MSNVLRVSHREVVGPAGNKGFTLVEFLAVLAIMGVLFGMAFGLSGFATRSAQRGRALSDLERLAHAVENFFVENGVLPVALTEITNRLPPSFRFNSEGLPLDPWSHPYQYTNTTDYSYRLFSFGPDGPSGSPESHLALGG